MVPLSGGAQIERNLQNATVIRMAGFTHLHIFCLKIEEKKVFSYNMYCFAINRISQKTLQYVYLGFSVGVKVVEKLFF